ncbi:MAG: pantoate--beta-alanine ligase [Ilumatobacteraceae bacterium]
MITVHTSADARRLVRDSRARGDSIGFVPTMGALHAGHRSLLKYARKESDFVVASIFVNPKQFDQASDLEKYPATLDDDLAMCAAEGVDLVYAPNAASMYPKDHEVAVSVPKLGALFEGAKRPGHFDGVALVVTKLLSTVSPDVAYFGQKDFQQTLVIRRLVRDLDLGTSIKVLPTVRDDDGLALSSRNVRLDTRARQIATAIPTALEAARRSFERGAFEVGEMKKIVHDSMTAAGLQVDYVDVVDENSLESLDSCRPGAVILVAATIDGVRLIDNVILGQ